MVGVPFNPMQTIQPAGAATVGLVDASHAAAVAAQDPLLNLYFANANGGGSRRPETYGESYFAQGMSGLNEGIGMALGAPVDLATAGLNLGIAGLNALFPPERSLTDLASGKQPEPRFKPIVDPIGGSQMFNRLMGTVRAITPETDDPGKQMLRRASQDIGAAVAPGLGGMSRAARPVTALVKELTLAGGSGAGAAVMEQLAPDNPWAELAGQILGSVSTAGAVHAGKRVITPLPVRDKARLAAAETMRRAGIDLTAGQQTGNKTLQSVESEWGGARLADLTERQAKQFTRATLKRAGIDAERVSSEVIEAGRRNLLAGIEEIGSRNALHETEQFADDLNEAWQRYTDATAPSEHMPAIEGFITAIKENRGPISGAAYVRLRKWLGDRAGLTTNAAGKSTLNTLQHALDDAMERSLSEADIDAFRQLRDEYRSLLTIEQVMKDTPGGLPSGLISPAALSKAAAPKPGRGTYAAGHGDFADLARSGVEVMTPPSQTGVPPTIRRLGNALPTVAGGLIGHSVGDWQTAAQGALAGAFVPSVAGGTVLSNAGRRYLANHILNGPPSGSNGFGPLSAMFAAQTSQLSAARDPLAELAGLADTVELVATKPGPIEIVVRGGNPDLSQEPEPLSSNRTSKNHGSG